ncbi:hypothetical protein HPB51_020535 [Rhipicephalus microplus]|uniref:Carboxypeptidase n=1 Tax=Rhipicephalus microplus TaxID=6941 RepID=A0A9J6EUY9_RHIMP|nr:hypothetical protein HPB51_020535 [Rhipicephalus microplus]
MIMRDAVVEGSGNFDHLGFFNVHPNLSTRAYSISASIGNAAAAAGIETRDLRNVPLYIFSESYGGKMAAEFALQLYKAHASGKVLCKLSGVALGDGWLSPLDSTSTWGQYLYTMLTNGIDWYNILLPQQEQPASLGAVSLPSDKTIGRAFVRHVAHFYNIFIGTLTELMNGPIKEKLGSIPKNVTWGGQSGAVFQALKADFMLPAVDAVEIIANDPDTDIVNVLPNYNQNTGTLQWMEQLRWPGMKEFQATAKKPMVVEGEAAGYYKSFKNLTLYWVLKAGHMVPADAPLAAQSMARHITMGKW